MSVGIYAKYFNMENRGEEAYGGKREYECWNLCEVLLDYNLNGI